MIGKALVLMLFSQNIYIVLKFLIFRCMKFQNYPFSRFNTYYIRKSSIFICFNVVKTPLVLSLRVFSIIYLFSLFLSFVHHFLPHYLIQYIFSLKSKVLT